MQGWPTVLARPDGMWFAYVFGHARKRSEGVTTGSDTRVASIRVGASEVRDVIVVVRDPTFLGRYRLPLDGSLKQKFDALEERFELRVIGTALEGSPTTNAVFRLVPPFRPRKLDGARFFLSLPFRIREHPSPPARLSPS